MFARSIIRRSAQQIGCSATSTVPAEHVEILRRDPNPKVVAAIVLGSLASYWVLCKKDEQTNGGPSYWAGKLFLNHGNFSFQPRTMNALYAKLGQN